MEWRRLESEEQLAEIDVNSHERAAIILKNSTRCILSHMVLSRMRREAGRFKGYDLYLLDLLRFRSASKAVADHYGVEHASPQVLVVKNGHCVYHASHTAIEPQLLEEVLAGVG